MYPVRLNGALSPCRRAGLGTSVAVLPGHVSKLQHLEQTAEGQLEQAWDDVGNWHEASGQATNPRKRLIEAMARTFGVRPSFFFGDHDENQADLIQEEVEMLAMIRDASITADQLRPFLRLSPQARS